MLKRAVSLSVFLASAGVVSWAQTSTLPYQDKIIEGNLATDTQEIAEQSFNREGLPRGYTLETSLDRRGVTSVRGNTTQVLGLRASGYMDTLYWGSFSANLGLQQGRSTSANQSQQSSQRTQWQIRQQGMPLDGGWQLDNALGQINLPVPELARNSLRIGLPTAGMLGLSSQWRQAAGMQINAALGQSGGFAGFPVPSFETTGGQYAYVSMQDRLNTGAGNDASRWLYGATIAKAQNLPAVNVNTNAGAARVNAQSFYAAAQRQWQGNQGAAAQPNSLQLNALHSASNGISSSGQELPATNGIWLDGGFNRRGHANLWGLFYLEPNLSWLDAPVANDLQGGYWRHSWRTRQWSSESNIELLSPVQGNTPAGFFASQALRYQYSTLLSFGGSVNLRRYNTDGESVLGYSQWTHDLGSTRAQVELARSEPADKLVRMQIDHDFNATGEFRLSTSLSADREKRNGLLARGWGLALSADWQFAPDLSLTSSIQSRSAGGQVQYSLNSGLSWRIAPQWSLNATVFAVQGNPQSGSLVQSPLTAPVASVNRLQDKGVFISLRYMQAAGSAQAPIGGAVGSAAGSVQGVVYLDENGNGKQEASERGVPQVTVMLDGRFSVDTDSQGRFEFPYVAAGAHIITLVSDNLPLPWSVAGDGKQTIRVNTRDQTRVSIGAVKN